MVFYIQNIESGLVLDIEGGSDEDGARVIVYDYRGEDNQLWEYKDGMVYSKLNGNVLDLSETDGSVCVWPAHGGPNQKWDFESDGTIINHTGLVLDIEGGDAESGTPLIGYEKHGGGNQLFRIVPLKDQEPSEAMKLAY